MTLFPFHIRRMPDRSIYADRLKWKLPSPFQAPSLKHLQPDFFKAHSLKSELGTFKATAARTWCLCISTQMWQVSCPHNEDMGWAKKLVAVIWLPRSPPSLCPSNPAPTLLSRQPHIPPTSPHVPTSHTHLSFLPPPSIPFLPSRLLVPPVWPLFPHSPPPC